MYLVKWRWHWSMQGCGSAQSCWGWALHWGNLQGFIYYLNYLTHCFLILNVSLVNFIWSTYCFLFSPSWSWSLWRCSWLTPTAIGLRKYCGDCIGFELLLCRDWKVSWYYTPSVIKLWGSKCFEQRTDPSVGLSIWLAVALQCVSI